MGVQTVDASAVWRYALSMVVQSKHVCALLHQPGYKATAWHPEDLCPRSTALLKSSSGGTGIVSFPRSSSVEPLSPRISAAASAGNATGCDAVCHHFNKNWQESVPVTRISHVLHCERSKRPLAMASPSPTCAVRFVKTLSKPLDHHDIPNGENHEANCIVTTLCRACDIQNQSHVQLACVKHSTARHETKPPRQLGMQSSK